jgi:hypothetical protein
MEEFFEHRLSSPHTAEDTWEVLRTPIWDHLGQQVYPYASLSYLSIDTHDSLLREGSMILVRPLRGLPPYITPSLRGSLPEHITMKIEELSDQKRVDVFESDVIQGKIERRVEPGENDTSILVVEGNVAVKGLDKLQLAFVNNSDKTPAYYLGLQANKKIIELTPRILDDARPYSRKQKLSILYRNQPYSVFGPHISN